MNFIGIGDLVLDCYLKNNEVIYMSGGKSFANIVFNLKYLGNISKIYGCCGNDKAGDMCLESLNAIGVDTIGVNRINKPTRKFYIYGDNYSITKKAHPVTEIKTWYNSSQIDTEKIILNIASEDVLIFDNLCSSNLKIVNNKFKTNDILIDIGYINSFKYLSKENIIDMLSQKFKIINMNERVEKFMLNKFKYNSVIDLKEMLKCELLIVTRGKKGSDFVTNGNIYNKKIDNPTEEIDPNGPGDMFFASVINDYYKGIRDYNDIFNNALKLTSKVVQNIGSRSYAF